MPTIIYNNNITAYAQQLYFFAEQGIEQAKTDGANYWYIDFSLPEEYPKNWSVERIDALIKQIQINQIKPILHGNFKIPLATDIDNVRNEALKTVLSEVDLAAELSAPLIIHGGAIVEPRLVIKAKRDALHHYLKNLESIVTYAAKKGVTILLENLSNYKNYRPFHYIFTTPEEYRFIFDRLNAENMLFFFDIGHGAICDGDPVAVIHEFHQKIWGMSFSNNDGVRDLHMGINKGFVDYEKVVSKIIETSWKGVVAFEVRDRSFKQNIDDLNKIFSKVHAANYHFAQCAN